MTLQIPIKHKTKGTNTMFIDKEDYDKIKDLNLTLNHMSNPHTFYAISRVYKNSKYIKRIHIHRLLMGLGDYTNDKRIINHIDGNGLNNCKSNLEICTGMYNSQSFRCKNKNVGNIYYDTSMKRIKRWRCCITINKIKKSKRFLTKEECVIWRDEIVKSFLQ